MATKHADKRKSRTGVVREPGVRKHEAPKRYGPTPDNAWTLSEGRLSLVRRRPRPRPLPLDVRPLPLQIDLARSALVIVDMQNDFCHPQGWFGQKGVDVRPMRKPIPVLRRLIAPWRDAGGHVLWLNWGVRADRLNLPSTLHFKSKHRPGQTTDAPGYAEHSPVDRGPAVVPGAWGAHVVDELEVGERDLLVNKHRLSGFWDNELDSLLRMQSIETLLFSGVNTDRCVFATLQDAGFLGYDCLLVADACSTPSPAYVTRSIHFLVRQLHGFVIDSRAVLDGLAQLHPPSTRRP